MDLVVVFAIAGLLVNRAIDLIRTGLDKDDSIPKAWWLLGAWLLGIALAWASCGTGLGGFIGIENAPGCFDQVLAGLGFGSVAGFWHEILSALSAMSPPAATPKGLLPR